MESKPLKNKSYKALQLNYLLMNIFVVNGTSGNKNFFETDRDYLNSVSTVIKILANEQFAIIIRMQVV